MKNFSLSSAELFTKFYSPDGLFSKIGSVAKSSGVKVIYGALLLYYALFDKDVSIKDKAIVIGALGYFILPADMIPDFLPGGYVDDLGVVTMAVKAIWSNISDSTRSKARKRLSNWFDNVDPLDLKLF